MRRRKNSYRVLSVLMALVMLFLTPVYSVSDVEAASKRSGAIQIPYSFKNLNGNNKAFAKTNYIWVAMGTGYSQQKYSTKNIKVSATVYVPKKVVSKENSAFYVDFMGVVDPETYGDTSNQKLLTSKYLAGIWNNGEKIKISAKGNRLILEQIPKSKRKTLEELLENFDSENYQPYEVDWGKPVGREIW